jgi:hypothetical protein
MSVREMAKRIRASGSQVSAHAGTHIWQNSLDALPQDKLAMLMEGSWPHYEVESLEEMEKRCRRKSSNESSNKAATD